MTYKLGYNFKPQGGDDTTVKVKPEDWICDNCKNKLIEVGILEEQYVSGIGHRKDTITYRYDKTSKKIYEYNVDIELVEVECDEVEDMEYFCGECWSDISAIKAERFLRALS